MLRHLSHSPGTEVPGAFFFYCLKNHVGDMRTLNNSFHPHQSTVVEMATPEGVNGTTCDAQQYQQSLVSSTNPNPSITCLTHGQSIGLAVSTQSLCLDVVSQPSL
jgi:hypothetical protein